MNTFDKLCALIAGLLGVVLLIFGGLGTFVGVKLWLTLPPVVSIVVAFAGWGILRPIYLAWNLPPRGEADAFPPEPALSDDERDSSNP